MKTVKQGQLFKLMCIQMFTTMIAFLMGMVIKQSGYNAPLGMLLGILAGMLVLYPSYRLAIRRPNRFFADYGKNIVGRWLHIPLVLFMVVALFYISILNCWQLGDFLVQFYLTATPPWVVALICAVCIAYLAYSGSNTIFRAAEGLFPLVFFSLLTIPFFVSNNLNWYMLNALVTQFELIRTWPPVYFTASIYGELSFLIFIFPLLSSPGKTFRTMFTAALLSFAVILCHVIPVLLIFGAELAGNFHFPDLELLRFMRSGSFLETLDPFIIVLWVISIFIKISFNVHLASVALGGLFGLKGSKPLVLPIVATIAVFSLIVVRSSAQFLEMEKNGFATLLLTAELIPLLYLIVDSIRSASKRRA